MSETDSNVDSLGNSNDSFFGDLDDGPVMTDEPLELSTSFQAMLPPSPRSMTMCSESSASVVDIPHHDYDINTLTPPRTLSYSDSEPDLYDEDASQPCEPEVSPSYLPAVSDEVRNDVAEKTTTATTCAGAPSADSTCQISPADPLESETPTPKPERQSTSFFDAKPELPHRRHRSLSPSRPLPLSRREVAVHCSQRDPRNAMPAMQSPRTEMVGCSAARRSRRTRGEEASRIRKLSPDAMRLRPRARRQMES